MSDVTDDLVVGAGGEAVADRLATDEVVRRLHAEIAALRAELERRDAALAGLGERLVPVEQARAAGAAGERERREAAERELRALQSTRLYRLLLRPRAALYRWRSGTRPAMPAPSDDAT